MISRELQMTSYLGGDYLSKCVSVENGELILMRIMKTLQSEYTIDILNPKDEYSKEIIRSKFTRDIASAFKEAQEELIMAMDDLIPASEHSA
jgi:hypothetical protein